MVAGPAATRCRPPRESDTIPMERFVRFSESNCGLAMSDLEKVTQAARAVGQFAKIVPSRRRTIQRIVLQQATVN